MPAILPVVAVEIVRCVKKRRATCCEGDGP
jgi:hypothetical protein